MHNDLRSWLALMDDQGELVHVKGADWNLEMGVLSELWGSDAQALLFDDIRGYPSGHRVLTNALNSSQRISQTVGLPPLYDKVELVKALRELFRNPKLVPPVEVDWGPVLENSMEENDVDLYCFPAPFFHEHDGGRFIGTGCLGIMRDPESGWINFGTYRLQIQDRNHTGIYITLGKHGHMILDKYWSRGKPCPIAVSVGHDPLLFVVSGIEIPYGVSEYDFAGALRGEPVEVLKETTTGLPIPAHSEIVLVGEIRPEPLVEEGPFGEWTGYYASGAKLKPQIHVKRILHRDQPIIFAAAPGKPPSDNTYFRSPIKSAAIWDELEKAGVPGVKGVWLHEAGGGRLWLIVSIEQLYPGHSKQAGHIAAHCHQGAYSNRFVVVVDEDIDPGNTDDVLWAMATRTDLRWDLDLIHRTWTTPNDPMHFPEDEYKDVFNSRMIIDACRPWERRKSFPLVASSNSALKEQVYRRWQHLFDQRAKKTGTEIELPATGEAAR